MDYRPGQAAAQLLAVSRPGPVRLSPPALAWRLVRVPVLPLVPTWASTPLPGRAWAQDLSRQPAPSPVSLVRASLVRASQVQEAQLQALLAARLSA